MSEEQTTREPGRARDVGCGDRLVVLVELLPGPLEVVRRTAQVASEDLGLDPAGADLGDPDAVTQHVVAQLKRHAATGSGSTAPAASHTAVA